MAAKSFKLEIRYNQNSKQPPLFFTFVCDISCSTKGYTIETVFSEIWNFIQDIRYPYCIIFV